MKIWIDSEHKAPEGYIHCQSDDAAIAWIKDNEKHAKRCMRLAKEMTSAKGAFLKQAKNLKVDTVSISPTDNNSKVVRWLRVSHPECTIETHIFDEV